MKTSEKSLVFSRRLSWLYDGLGLILILLITLLISHEFRYFLPIANSEQNILIGTAVVIISCVTIWQRQILIPGFHSLAYVIPGCTVAFSILLLFIVLMRIEYSRSTLIVGYVCSTCWLMLRAQHKVRRRDFKLLVIPFGRALDLIGLSDHSRFQLMNQPSLPNDKEFHGVVADLQTDDMPPQWNHFLAELSLYRIPVFDSAIVYENLSGRVSIDHLANNRLGMLMPSQLYLPFKYLIEMILAVLLLVLLSPLLLCIIGLIKFTSKGPVIFSQPRVGLNGKTFTMYKFRTMFVNNSHFTHSTVASDKRITSIGQYLRRFRFDELPQLWNVLCGDMSLIGPRPSVDKINQINEQSIPFYPHRHVIRPGITGWAQVSQGYALDEEPDSTREKIERDFYYIKHFSLWIDLLIVALTLFTIATSRGAR